LKNPFRYRSYYYDFETNLYYLNSRYYDPETGRFVNADDIGVLTQAKDILNGLNLYSYCNNNPVNFTDENGNAWWDWIWKIALAVVVVAVITIATAVTAGAFAAALGASAAIVSSVITCAGIGGAVFGGLSIVNQLVNNGIDNFNFMSVAIDSFCGAVYGAISGGVGAVGSTSAKIIGGIGKVFLSGFTTLFHGLNLGQDKNSLASNILSSMILSSIIQTITIGAYPNSSKTILSKIFNNVSQVIVFGIEALKGIWQIIDHKIFEIIRKTKVKEIFNS